MLSLLIVLSLLAAAPAAQTSLPARPPDGPKKPHQDPVKVRGCLDKRYLRITEHDIADLSGAISVRLKGPRALMSQLDDNSHRYVEVIGAIVRAPGDRVDAYKKYKVGPKTTVAVGAHAKQGDAYSRPVGDTDPVLEVESFEVLGDRCDAR